MEERELKPCPFCGENVRISHDGLRKSDSGMSYKTVWTIFCQKCKCNMMKEEAYYSFNYDGVLEVLDDGRATLVKRWNTRH